MDNLKRIFEHKHFKYGLPFMIMVVGGSFVLRLYSDLRYEIQKERKIVTKTKELRQMIGPANPVSIEEEYEEYKKTIDIDNWKNIRGPRPWEGDNVEYKDLIEKRARESKQGWVFK